MWTQYILDKLTWYLLIKNLSNDAHFDFNSEFFENYFKPPSLNSSPSSTNQNIPDR